MSRLLARRRDRRWCQFHCFYGTSSGLLLEHRNECPVLSQPIDIKGGGGQIGVLVDRKTKHYPPPGARVRVRRA